MIKIINPFTLKCQLPPALTSGTVQVTLSRFQEPDKPQFGQGYCLFKYNSGRDYLWVAFVSHMECNVQQFKLSGYTILSAMASQKHDVTPETWDSMILQILQNVSEAGRKTLHDATQPTQPTNQSSSVGIDKMESWMLEFLSSLANSPGWKNTVSLVNMHHQTLAHLAILSQYTALLQKVTWWGIDMGVKDVNGSSALHCAYSRYFYNALWDLEWIRNELNHQLCRRPNLCITWFYALFQLHYRNINCICVGTWTPFKSWRAMERMRTSKIFSVSDHWICILKAQMAWVKAHLWVAIFLPRYSYPVLGSSGRRSWWPLLNWVALMTSALPQSASLPGTLLMNSIPHYQCVCSVKGTTTRVPGRLVRLHDQCYI